MKAYVALTMFRLACVPILIVIGASRPWASTGAWWYVSAVLTVAIALLLVIDIDLMAEDRKAR